MGLVQLLLTAKVHSWPCLSLACLAEPRSFQVVGLAYCKNLDTSVPGTYEVTFSVGYGVGLHASITRRVVVLPRCGAVEKMCDDGTCAPTHGASV